jgi:hypothetical protein
MIINESNGCKEWSACSVVYTLTHTSNFKLIIKSTISKCQPSKEVYVHIAYIKEFCRLYVGTSLIMYLDSWNV